MPCDIRWFVRAEYILVHEKKDVSKACFQFIRTRTVSFLPVRFGLLQLDDRAHFYHPFKKMGAIAWEEGEEEGKSNFRLLLLLLFPLQPLYMLLWEGDDGDKARKAFLSCPPRHLAPLRKKKAQN